jgi:hypothetical protein
MVAGLGNVDNTSDANKPISALTQAALDTLTATVASQGTAIAGKADNSALVSYYTKAQIDSSLGQKQGSITTIGDDTNGGTGIKLLDATNNLRSLKGVDPYQFSLNGNTIYLEGPPRIGFNGDNATNGYNLQLNNIVKSLKPGGYIQITQDPGAITISTTNNLDTVLSSKANASAIPSLTGYLNAATNDTADISNPKLIVLGTSGSSLTIDYAQLRATLNLKANTSAIPDVSGFINAVSNYAGDTSTTKLITLGKSGQTITTSYQGLLDALIGKQNALTVIGDNTSTLGYALHSGTGNITVKSLKAGTNMSFTQTTNDLTINGPNLTGYATTSSLSSYATTSSLSGYATTSSVAAKQDALTVIGDNTSTLGYTLHSGTGNTTVKSLKAGTNMSFTQTTNDLTINGPNLSGYATTTSLSGYAPLASPTFTGTLTVSGGDILTTNNAYGRIMGSDGFHAVIMRGDTAYDSVLNNYYINAGDNMTFVEYSGTFRFKRITNNGIHDTLCTISPSGMTVAGTINTGDLQINGTSLSTTFAKKPWAAGRVTGIGTVDVSVGQTSFNISSAVPGLYNISYSQSQTHPNGATYTVMATPYQYLSVVVVSGITSTGFVVTVTSGTGFGTQAALPFSFQTIP